MAAAWASALPAQDKAAATAVTIDVPLAVKPLAEPSFSFGVEFDGKDAAGCIAAIGSPRTGHLPGGVLVRVEALAAPPHAYRVTVDIDGDGDLGNEDSHELKPDGSFDLELRRAQGAQQRRLAYRISYERREEGGGLRGGEWMRIAAHYRAEGRLRLGDEDALVGVLDVDADGVFDSSDMLRGTAIGIDVDGDGRIWGANECFGAGQIISFAGRHLVAAADALRDDGCTVRFQETTLLIPKVGEVVPPFSLRLLDGSEFTSAGMRGHRWVFDFWASWCAPCVAGIPKMQALAAELANGDPDLLAVYCSTDRSARLPEARAVVEKLALPKGRVAATGRAEQEPMWQMLGSMPEVRMSIPAYVVIDAGGILRYAGRNLDEVKAALIAAAARDGAAKQAR
jgi:thiol-disulfide isomerase/thioredoxin